jgi:hypothetical protein
VNALPVEEVKMGCDKEIAQKVAIVSGSGTFYLFNLFI